MAKSKLLVTCFEVHVKEEGSVVSFIAKKAKQPAPVPGQQLMIHATATIQINFEDRQAAQYEPGKPYTITIE